MWLARSVRKRLCLFISFMICGALVVVPAQPALAYPCDYVQARAGTWALNVSVATGVQATIKTPDPGDVYNYDPGKFSIADIYMRYTGGGGGFVQLGWYLGNASQLPYTNQPRLFWGENTPTGEMLHAGPLLTWGAVYAYMITNPLDGSNRFNIWFQGNIIAQTTYGHNLNYPAFNGEVAYKCTRMWAIAAHGVAPLRTLRYRYGSWYYFSGTPFDDPGFISTSAGDIATNFSYGGG